MISSGSAIQCMRSNTIGSPFPHRSDSQGDPGRRGPRGRPEHPAQAVKRMSWRICILSLWQLLVLGPFPISFSEKLQRSQCDNKERAKGEIN